MSVSTEHFEKVRSAIRSQLLIGGKWVDAQSGRTFDTMDPSTGERIASVAEGDAADIDAAVKAARKSFDDGVWRSMTPSQRGKIMWRVGDLIEQHAEEFTMLEVLDVGKPVTITRQGDIPFTADVFRYYAGWTTKLEGATIPISAPGAWHAYTLREPIGVCGLIIPWNFPLVLASWKLGPALATGNSVVVKPAEQTPLSTLFLAELLQEAGVPDGVVNVVTGYGETAGAALAEHPGVDKISFTGSTGTAQAIIKGGLGNLKRISLELGGKSPNIIFDDADIARAIPASAFAIFYNAGEACSAGSRLYVQKRNFDNVISGIVDEAKKLKVGPAVDPETTMGPVITSGHRTVIADYLESGLAEGAEAAVGGRALDESGYFIEPTVLVNTTASMKVVREEIFGPVVVAMPFDDIDDIVRQANDTKYGLAAGVWTQDLTKAHSVAAALKAGHVYVNNYGTVDAALPFGGFKQSGWGRELGKDALELYTETKAVVVSL